MDIDKANRRAALLAYAAAETDGESRKIAVALCAEIFGLVDSLDRVAVALEKLAGK